jgi:hypothetical protein
MRCARPVRSGFSPLDEELGLLPGQLTPRLPESLVRLGTWRPFAQAAEMVALFTGVVVSEPTVRRTTEGAGAAYVAVPTAAVETSEQTVPSSPAGPAVQLLRVDGAMVPLQPQEWAEVKTLAIGTVGKPVREGEEWVVHTGERSDFSRLTDAETFGRLALVETHRRGTETARTVCAVSDGAEGIQGVVDLHRPDAVRILDFPHALSAVAQAGQAVYGEGTTAFTLWFTPQRHVLKHGTPEEVLAALRRLAAMAQRRKAQSAVATVRESLSYLEKRRGMLVYAWCHARGYPIGSGSVESANKLGVERRLKGAGMHGARAHVKPRVALRAMACSARWQEAWPQMAQHCQHQARHRRWRHQRDRRHAKAPPPVPLPQPAQPVALTPAPAQGARPAPRRSSPPQPTACQGAKGPYRPPPDHPWRRLRISWKGSQHTSTLDVAKL